jgi:hypothetical protein
MGGGRVGRSSESRMRVNDRGIQDERDELAPGAALALKNVREEHAA